MASITAVWQVEVGGLVLGARPYIVEEVTGLGVPDYRASDRARSQDHGSFAASEHLTARTVEVRLRVVEWLAVDAGEAFDALKAAWVDAASLSLWQPGWDTARVLFGVPRRLAADTRMQKVGLVVVDLQFLATDPRLYGALVEHSVGLPTTSGGVAFPATFPLAFGSVSVGGRIDATNDGTFPTRPVATITGPVDNPRIENVTAGKTVRLAISIDAGDTLEIDFDARSVTLNGTASRRSALTADSDWWELAPGANEIRYLADSFIAASILTLAYRPAWT